MRLDITNWHGHVIRKWPSNNYTYVIWSQSLWCRRSLDNIQCLQGASYVLAGKHSYPNTQKNNYSLYIFHLCNLFVIHNWFNLIRHASYKPSKILGSMSSQAVFTCKVKTSIIVALTIVVMLSFKMDHDSQ